MNTITWKIASLPVERMDIGPNHSVRVLAVVPWGIITRRWHLVEDRAGRQVMSPPQLWDCGTAWSRADFSWSYWVLPLIMLLMSECSAFSFGLDWNQGFSSVSSLMSFPAWLAILMGVFSACCTENPNTQSRSVLCHSFAQQPWACPTVGAGWIVPCWVQWMLLSWTAEVWVALGHLPGSSCVSTTELEFTALAQPSAQGPVLTRVFYSAEPASLERFLTSTFAEDSLGNEEICFPALRVLCSM